MQPFLLFPLKPPPLAVVRSKGYASTFVGADESLS